MKLKAGQDIQSLLRIADEDFILNLKLIVIYDTVVGVFFYVKNDWCELLFRNSTVRKTRIWSSLPLYMILLPILRLI